VLELIQKTTGGIVMKKQLGIILLSAAMAAAFTFPSFAAVTTTTTGTGDTTATVQTVTAASIIVNGSNMGSKSYIKDGMIFVPATQTAKQLGFSKTVVKTKFGTKYKYSDGTTTVALTPKNYRVSINGHSFYVSSSSAFAYANKKLYVEADAFAEYFGANLVTDSGKVELTTAVANDGVKVSTKHIAVTYKKLHASISYPSVSGMSDETVQAAINKVFYNKAVEAVKAGKENAKALSGFSTAATCETFFNYEVSYNQNGILSVIIDDYQYAGGAHGSTVQSGMNFDLATGKQIGVSDLFQDKTGAFKEINDKVSSLMKEREKYGVIGFEDSPFKTIENDQDYYLSNGGLTIFFQEDGSYYPYAAGIQTFQIPYSSLKAYLGTGFSKLALETTYLDRANVTELAVGQTAYITNNSNPTTGYTWTEKSDNDKVLQIVKHYYVQNPAPAGATGVGGCEIVIVKAVSAGTASITCSCERSWEGATSAVDQATYKVTVK
jgi:Predicted secreted protein